MKIKPQLKMDFQRMKAKVQRVNDQAASRKEIGRTLMIPLEDIEVVSNVRKHFNEASIDELADSIKSLGQQSPITVKAHETEPGKWVLVTGERRFRAVKKLGMPTILAREDDGSHTTAKQIVENIQREDMSILDIGRALHELKELEGLNVKAMAALLGKDQRFVYRALIVTELPEEIQELCVKNILRDGVAIECLMRMIKKNQDWKGWIVSEVLAEVESQTQNEKNRARAEAQAAEEGDDNASISGEENESGEVEAEAPNIVITRKFVTELEVKLKRKKQRRPTKNPIPLRDEPLTLANADRLKRIKGYENYKFNGLKARITCMFMLPDVFGDDTMHGGEEDPLQCAQFTTISVESPNVAVIEFQNKLYEVPIENVVITGIYPLKDLKAKKE